MKKVVDFLFALVMVTAAAVVLASATGCATTESRGIPNYPDGEVPQFGQVIRINDLAERSLKSVMPLVLDEKPMVETEYLMAWESMNKDGIKIAKSDVRFWEEGLTSPDNLYLVTRHGDLRQFWVVPLAIVYK